MNIRASLLAAVLATTAVAAPVPALGRALEVQRFGLYVLVDDVERSVAFYAALFGSEPQVRTPALVGFDVAGGLFAIVSRRSYAPDARPDGRVRPYLKVADLDAAFERVNRLAPGRVEGGRVVTEGPFRFFRFADPDGNVVELFSVGSPSPPR